MARTRLIGDFGKASIFTLGSAVTTGTLAANSDYIVAAIGGSSALPTGRQLKKAFRADGTEDLTGPTGDDVRLITEVDQCDISSISVEFSKDEVPVTTLCDTVKTYEAGKTDITGTMEGVYRIGVTNSSGGIQNNVVDIVSQADAGGAITYSQLTGSTIYISMYVQEDSSSGETLSRYIIPLKITTFSQGVVEGEAQTFSASFRITPDDLVDFHYFEIVIA